MKRCPRCERELEEKHFCQDRHAKDGLKGTCRECAKMAHQEWKERRQANSLKWESKRRGTKYDVSRTVEEIRAHKKKRLLEYMEANKDEIRERRAQRQRTPEAKRLRNLQRAKRRATDLQYRLECVCRKSINQAMCKQRTRKTSRTITLLGCSIHDFKMWLELNFLPGMSWENYGFGINKWNIDHYMPCSSFQLSDMEQQKKCFHWSNQFPCWQTENFKKNDQIPPPLDEIRLSKIAEFQRFIDSK